MFASDAFQWTNNNVDRTSTLQSLTGNSATVPFFSCIAKQNELGRVLWQHHSDRLHIQSLGSLYAYTKDDHGGRVCEMNESQRRPRRPVAVAYAVRMVLSSSGPAPVGWLTTAAEGAPVVLGGSWHCKRDQISAAVAAEPESVGRCRSRSCSLLSGEK
jgi:hypothetical protein